MRLVELIPSCNERQRTVSVHLLPSHPPILPELEEECIIHRYRVSAPSYSSNGVEQTLSRGSSHLLSESHKTDDCMEIRNSVRRKLCIFPSCLM